VLVRALLVFILFWVIARLFWRFIGGVVRGASTSAAAGRQTGGGAPVKMQPCPACGTYVVPGKAISSSTGGVPVYFCSETCRAQYASR